MNLCICQYWPVNLWMDRRDSSVRQVLAECTRYSPVLPGRVMQGDRLPLLCLGMKELDLKMIKTPFVLNDTDKVSHSASPTCCHLQWRGQYSGCYHYVVDKTSLDRTWAGGCWHVDILNLGSVEHSLFSPESKGGEVSVQNIQKCFYVDMLSLLSAWYWMNLT